ncbi:MAG: hypothetical protein GY821_13400 [Gammaproteobacteria bacterium]|nr:hypothetical protein [Gammaproteobacteria bacterium]
MDLVSTNFDRNKLHSHFCTKDYNKYEKEPDTQLQNSLWSTLKKNKIISSEEKNAINNQVRFSKSNTKMSTCLLTCGFIREAHRNQQNNDGTIVLSTPSLINSYGFGNN